jgi:hypothetical protein
MSALTLLPKVTPEVTKPKRPRRVWKGQLVLKNGRLTRGFWMLQEGMTQGVRGFWIPAGSGGPHGRYDFYEYRWLAWLVEQNYMEARPGPRNKEAREYHTTPDGALAWLIAKGHHEARTKK